MALIRTPHVECDRVDCNVRVEVPPELLRGKVTPVAWLPPGWHRHTFMGSSGPEISDYHSVDCLKRVLNASQPAVEGNAQAMAVEPGILARVPLDYWKPGAQAQQKMDRQHPADHMFNGDPENPLICKDCRGDHMT
jgi:hypothetical protein